MTDELRGVGGHVLGEGLAMREWGIDLAAGCTCDQISYVSFREPGGEMEITIIHQRECPIRKESS